MSETVKPTRSELMKARKRIKLAKKGHGLLKKKQDSLMIEFFNLLKEVKELRERLQEHYQVALTRMNEARALESDLRIKAASLTAKESAPVEIDVKNIAGVRIPQIEQIEHDRELPLYESITLQDLSVAYGKVIADVLRLAANETALRKILIEIRKTKRRANALENILIPNLERAVNYIRFQLEEREREEFNRLKQRKRVS